MIGLAALLGLLAAFAGIFFSHHFALPLLDGAAPVVIGLILGTAPAFLAYESKGLLIGEGADPQTLENIRTLAQSDPEGAWIMNPLTMHFGPDTVLFTMDVQFHPKLSAAEVEKAVDRLEKAIRQRHPRIKHIYIEAGAIGSSNRDAPTPG